MHINFDGESEVQWDQYFMDQAVQSGHGAFHGSNFQRGHGLGNLFRGLFRMIVPIASAAAKTLGREAVFTGANIAHDVLSGQNIKTAAKRQGRQSASRLVDKVQKKLHNQKGQGILGKRTNKTVSHKVPTKRSRASVNHVLGHSQLLKTDALGIIV